MSEYEVKTIIDNYNDTISKFYEEIWKETYKMLKDLCSWVTRRKEENLNLKEIVYIFTNITIL